MLFLDLIYIVEIDFKRILTTHYFLVTSEPSPSEGDPSRNDTWVQCESNTKPKDFNSRWFEKNCTVQEYGNMPIWEPCNYASNLAYYHTTTEICSRQQWNLPENDGK